jgi:carbamoyl-phosphate synthase large subunit
MFSFTRLAGADPVLGVEMASTGEVGCIGRSFDEALLLSLEAAKCRRPRKGVLVSAGPESEKLKFLECAEYFRRIELPLFATAGTADYLEKHGFKVTRLAWPGEATGVRSDAGRDVARDMDVIRAIKEGLVDLVINVPKALHQQELSYGAQIRRAAVQFGCSLLTNMEATIAFSQALARCPDFGSVHEVLPLPPYRS